MALPTVLFPCHAHSMAQSFTMLIGKHRIDRLLLFFFLSVHCCRSQHQVEKGRGRGADRHFQRNCLAVGLRERPRDLAFDRSDVGDGRRFFSRRTSRGLKPLGPKSQSAGHREARSHPRFYGIRGTGEQRRFLAGWKFAYIKLWRWQDDTCVERRESRRTRARGR